MDPRVLSITPEHTFGRAPTSFSKTNSHGFDSG
jgi:hypothetical protein